MRHFHNKHVFIFFVQYYQKIMFYFLGAESDSTITDSPSLATSDDLSEDIEPIITKPTNEKPKIKPKPPPKPKVILTAEGKIQRIKDEETSKTEY